MNRVYIIIGIIMICLCLPTWAQEKKTPEGGAPEKDEATPGFDLPAPTGQYIYKPEGRRDPFMNPLAPMKGRESRQSIEGPGGLLIDELELEGIIRAYGTFRALLKGPDDKPYVLRVGDKVYDGEVVALDANSISFKKVSSILLPGQKEKIVVKTLNPEKED